MNKSLTTIESFFSAIPALAEMANAHAQQELEQATSGRRKCLEGLPALRAAESAAQKKLDAAVAALEVARQTARDLEGPVRVAAEAHRSAQRARSNAERDMAMVHGDGDVLKAAYKARLLLADCDQAIQNLEAQEFDRTMGYSRSRPEIKAKLAERRSQRKTIAAAIEGLEALIHSDTPPHELQTKAAALLQKAGYEPNPEPTLA